METIKGLREQIDNVDSQISALLVQRFALVKQIGAEKNKLALPVTDADRERDIICAAKSGAADKNEANAIAVIYKEIIAQSRLLEK